MECGMKNLTVQRWASIGLAFSLAIGVAGPISLSPSASSAVAAQAADGSSPIRPESEPDRNASQSAGPLTAAEEAKIDPNVLNRLRTGNGSREPIEVGVSVGLSRSVASAKAEIRRTKKIGANSAVLEPSFDQVLAQTRAAKQRLANNFAGITFTRDFEFTDIAAVKVSNEAEVAALLRTGEVTRIFANEEHQIDTAQSINVVRKHTAPASYYDGAGTHIAVLDSGVDYTHPAFGSCSAPGGSCGVSHVFEATPTNDFQLDDSVRHGTNVSAIALAVAPASKIIGVDVFTGTSASTLDITNGVNHVLGLKKSGVNVVAINLSLGFRAFTGGAFDCPFDDFYGIGPAQAAGISVVASSGNQARIDGVGRPSCIPGVISVGATYDANIGGVSWGTTCTDQSTFVDKIVCFSNSSARLDVLAPGAIITAGGVSMGGTSQASPHVAGAVALLAQKEPALSVSSRRQRLRNQGVYIYDSRNGVSRARLDLPMLLTGTGSGGTTSPAPPNDNRSSAASLPLPGSAGAENESATVEGGETLRGGRTVWWTVTSPVAQAVTIDTCGSSIDTYLAVFDGITEVASNDDADCGSASKLTLQMAAQTTYHIQADSFYPTSSGQIIVRVTPVNDVGTKTISPARLLDTRPGQTTVDGLSQGTGALAAGSTYTLQVAGRAGISAGATAAIFNVTAVTPLGDGWVTAYPCDEPRPQNTSSVNYTTGSIVGNLATIKLSAGGQVCLYTVASTDLTIDATGFFPVGSPYQPITPTRYLETRSGPGITTFDGQFAGTGQIGAGQTLALRIRGRGQVPANASSVTFNATAVTPSGPGWITAFPCDLARPATSSLNYAGGDIRANLATIQLLSSGMVCFYSEANAHLVVDVTGYQSSVTSFVATSPMRLLDSRPGQPTVDSQFSGTGWIPGTYVMWLNIGGRNGIPAGARAVTMNITVVPFAAGGWITAYPCGQPRPLASSLNFGASQVVANLAHIKLSSDGRVCIYASANTHVIVDVTGYDS
jgi:subtilisin family serine protease